MSDVLNDIQDVRQRAAAILSGRKLQMLEEAGMTVVDKRRLEALERLYDAARRCVMFGRVYGGRESFINGFDYTMWRVAHKDLCDAVDELEAMK
ncbi:hypothetical protein [Alicyclobacillus vulcanalis]|uniref:Uncharacterized protein n=1 Tax=Alicyclobacillus vulcanalis TaxID=252246 RepID=A0A1N7MRA6_9BACL|nr:hypothetical protein [Alicyclobacillus vulcanalis]SIS88664.1 hypothetical protein SAMN05421799_10652 [Alicyclobacillus vulcanalis]